MSNATEQLHEMIILTPGNPRRVSWNGVVEEQDQVRARFNELMRTNQYLAYKTTDVDKPTQRSEMIRDFDATAERITLTPRIVGGRG